MELLARPAGVALVTATMLAGCGGSQIGTTGAVSQATVDIIARHATSWMTRAASNGGDLLYVSEAGDDNAVGVYSYPQGVKVGQLTGFGTPAGLCVDGAGDVFVTNIAASGTSNIFEFAHGGTTPIQTLNDPGMEPSGCAVNPITGDLAVANYCPFNQRSGCGNGRGNILIYPEAKGSPRSHKALGVTHFSYCAYDNGGTLYADGYGRRSHSFELAELPKDGDKMATIQIHWTYSKPEIIDPGGVQWDGKFLSIGDPQGENVTPSVYRVDPSNGHIASVLTLHKSQSVLQYFIDGKVLIAPNREPSDTGQIFFYGYPKGERLSKAIDGLDMPVAVVISSGGHS
jgi:DNA-binding beta-propeller fold protein YncE